MIIQFAQVESHFSDPYSFHRKWISDICTSRYLKFADWPTWYWIQIRLIKNWQKEKPSKNITNSPNWALPPPTLTTRIVPQKQSLENTPPPSRHLSPLSSSTRTSLQIFLKTCHHHTPGLKVENLEESKGEEETTRELSEA